MVYFYILSIFQETAISNAWHFDVSNIIISSSMFGSSLPPHEDRAVFLLRPCILILKVAKNFRETFFRGVELIGVEVM